MDYITQPGPNLFINPNFQWLAKDKEMRTSYMWLS